MTPMVVVQVEELRSRFDGDVRVISDRESVALIFCTPRECAPLRTMLEIDEYLEAHPERSCLPLWDDILRMRVPFMLGLNHTSFKVLDCELPPLRAVK